MLEYTGVLGILFQPLVSHYTNILYMHFEKETLLASFRRYCLLFLEGLIFYYGIHVIFYNVLCPFKIWNCQNIFLYFSHSPFDVLFLA